MSSMSLGFAASPTDRVFAACVQANVPVIFVGSPGVGKTARMTARALAWGVHLEVLIGSIREPSDFLGMPVETDSTVMPDGTVLPVPSTANAVPSWAVRLVNAGPAILFLDELSTCSPATQKAMLRVIQERCVGDLVLPETVRIVAAMNPVDEAVDGLELAPPVANRFLHLPWMFDADRWFDGMTTGFDTLPEPALGQLASRRDNDAARMRGLVSGYLRKNPGRICPGVPTDPVQAAGAHASPRSWANLAAVLEWVHPQDTAAIRLAAQAAVGEGDAQAFTQYAAAAGLVDPEKVLADPTCLDWSTVRPDLAFALCGAVLSLTVSRGTKAAWEAAMALYDHAAGDRPDVVVPAVRKLLTGVPEGAVMPKRLHDRLRELAVAA